MAYNISRLTLFALISAIEEDLRQAILLYLGTSESPKELIGNDLFERCMLRLTSDIGSRATNLELVDLVQYIDFSDSFELLNIHRSKLPEGQAKKLKALTGRLSKLTPIRNRVAHSRPLNYDDLATTIDTAEAIIAEGALHWNTLETTMLKLKEEPSFVLGLTIPTYDSNKDSVSHNLPTPDFDETGFLGRETLVRQIVQLCRGPFPVISILGEGGIGKTALALKVAYEILDSKDALFDAVVWTSSKTAQLSVQEITRIEDAISDSLGMFRDVAIKLAGDIDIRHPLDEILEYLHEFRILLILDNLETVLDERVRDFLSKLPIGSKILITSRIGVGAYEYPVKLEPMTENEAIQLVRLLSQVRGVHRLFAVQNGKLARYCQRMNNNPGYIKWFVSAVQAGKRPEDILNTSHVFLDYCMSNVYEYLSPDGKSLLRAMLCIPGRHSQTELAYLTETDSLTLQQSIHELLRTNFVSMNSAAFGSSFETYYEMSEMSRRYLTKQHPASSEEYESLNRRKRQMTAAREQFEANQERNPYSFYSLAVRSKSDIITAKYLSDALRSANQNDYESAETLVSEARSLAPEYYEVYRIDAIIQTQMGNLTAARNHYESALELEPKSAPLRKWYGEFLLKYLDDAIAALVQIEMAIALDPNSIEILISQALTNMYLQRFEGATEILKVVIVERKNDVDFWNYRKAYDIFLECIYREAESLVDRRKVADALDKIELLLTEYQRCPVETVDIKMKEKLSKSSDLAMRCARQEAGSENEKRADTLAADLHRALYTVEGSLTIDGQIAQNGEISSIHPGYAFIRFDARHTVFVHRSEFPSSSTWQNLAIGQKVACYIVKDEKGRDKAIQVRLC